MADHGRFEQLAVAHVLGGLDAVESAEFRQHLLDCAECRIRVAELRGIATELEAAERDERARAQLRTELPQRTEQQDGEPTGGGLTGRHLGVLAILVLAIVGTLSFWNLHLRNESAARAAVSEIREDALRILATGTPLDAEVRDDLRAVAAIDDTHVAISLVGLERVHPGHTLVLWMLDSGGQATAESRLLAGAGPLDDELVVGVAPLGDGDVVVVTQELGTPGAQPRGGELLRVPLRGSDDDTVEGDETP